MTRDAVNGRRNWLGHFSKRQRNVWVGPKGAAAGDFIRIYYDRVPPAT